MRMSFKEVPTKWVVAILFLFSPLISNAGSREVASDTELPSALCQVVYPVDQLPSDQGYSYIFYGNGFFINEDGYLITAAHVVSTFHYGGQPHILLERPQERPKLLEASLVAVDWEHDVAVLRATPNPFQSDDKLAYLTLSDVLPAQGKAVLSASQRPPDSENAHTLDAMVEDASRSEVINYQFHWEKGARSELLLFSHEVVPGQSGSPLIAADSRGAVGIVVGRWLSPAVLPSSANGTKVTVQVGAALRIHYAINLLQEQHVAWHAAAEPSARAKAQPTQEEGFVPPAPLSIVATPYPPQAVYGGEVVLDALIDSNGKLEDVTVVHGDAPFLDTVLGAVHTWSFTPARMDGRAVEGRVGIVFQFPQSFLPNLTSNQHKYDEPLADSADRAALPVLTLEPDYPINSIAEGSVALYELVDADGEVTSTSVLSDIESLGASTRAALTKWQFVPGKQGGTKIGSADVIVVTFRRPASSVLTSP